MRYPQPQQATLQPPRTLSSWHRGPQRAPQVRRHALALQAGAQLLDGLRQRVAARLRLAQPPAQALARGRARALLRLHLRAAAAAELARR